MTNRLIIVSAFIKSCAAAGAAASPAAPGVCAMRVDLVVDGAAGRRMQRVTFTGEARGTR